MIIDACTYNKYQNEVLVRQARENNNGNRSGAVDQDDSVSAFEHLSLKNTIQDFAPMSGYECLLAAPYVKGFDLENKVWCR